MYLALGKYPESLQALAKAEKLLPGKFQVALVGGLAQLGADGFLATPVPPGTFPEELGRYFAMEMFGMVGEPITPDRHEGQFIWGFLVLTLHHSMRFHAP